MFLYKIEILRRYYGPTMTKITKSAIEVPVSKHDTITFFFYFEHDFINNLNNLWKFQNKDFSLYCSRDCSTNCIIRWNFSTSGFRFEL